MCCNIFVVFCSVLSRLMSWFGILDFIVQPLCFLFLLHNCNLSLCVRKPTIWVPTRSDTNRAVQSQKMARSLKFWIFKDEEGLYYLCSENKGADQISFAVTAKLICAFVFAYGRLLVFPCGGSFVFFHRHETNSTNLT